MRIAALARRRRRLNLTPMIDVVLLLLVFFMMVSRFGGLQGMPLAVAGAVLEVLACWKGVFLKEDQIKHIESYLATRPTKANDWVNWAIKTEQAARLEGIDLRDILTMGWPHHSVVSQTLAQWSRLGGMSCRSLFFTAIYGILRAEGIVK
jgi:hypothetical protein